MVQSTNNWGIIAAQLKKAAQQAVQAGAQCVQSHIQANAPVDTGFLQSSVYVSGPLGSDYGQAGEPPGDASLLPEATPDSDTSANVGCAASYGAFINYGHHTRGGGGFVPANPFFDQGVADALGELPAVMGEAFAAGLEDAASGGTSIGGSSGGGLSLSDAKRAINKGKQIGHAILRDTGQTGQNP